MTFAADGPTVSGQRYAVHEVDGRRPVTLDDFVGETAVNLHNNGLTYRVSGTGVKSDSTVRFYQKDVGPDGKDVRVWTISNPADDEFIAEHTAAH